MTMTERHAPYLHLLTEQDAPQAQESSSTHFTLGTLTLSLDDPEFLSGYEHGMQQYEQWHRDELTMDDSLLLSLVRNGWGGSRYSEMWQTGFIIGWLFALFAHATGTTADLSPIEE
jgi:hypothetical protein